MLEFEVEVDLAVNEVGAREMFGTSPSVSTSELLAEAVASRTDMARTCRKDMRDGAAPTRELLGWSRFLCEDVEDVFGPLTFVALARPFWLLVDFVLRTPFTLLDVLAIGVVAGVFAAEVVGGAADMTAAESAGAGLGPCATFLCLSGRPTSSGAKSASRRFRTAEATIPDCESAAKYWDEAAAAVAAYD